MLRRDFVRGLGLLSVLGPNVTWAAVTHALPPEGVRFAYRLLFSGTEIGTQKVFIRSHDKADHVVVEHEIDAEVRILFSVAYSLKHRSSELWHGFDLKSVNSDTVENGERYVIEGKDTPDGFAMNSAGRKFVAPNDVLTMDSFWLAAATKTPIVLNTRTGDTARPKITSLGDQRWRLKADFEHGPVAATITFDGDFLAHAEIDSDGHTVTIERVDG